MLNKLDESLARLRCANDDVNASRAEFRKTLNAWASEKTLANADAHERACDRLNAAVERLRVADHERVAARAELFGLGKESAS
jgi:hypothetical protein